MTSFGSYLCLKREQAPPPPNEARLAGQRPEKRSVCLHASLSTLASTHVSRNVFADVCRVLGSVSSYFPRDRKGVNALDYLSRYCILSEEQLRQYR